MRVGCVEVLLQAVLLVEMLQALLCTIVRFKSGHEFTPGGIRTAGSDPLSRNLRTPPRDGMHRQLIAEEVRTGSAADLDGLLGSLGALGLLRQAGQQYVVELLL